MAALDWAFRVSGILAWLPTLNGADAIVGELLIARLREIGEPYDAAYTSQVDIDKQSDAVRNAQELADWAASTEQVHNDARKVLNFVEQLYTDLSPITYPDFSPDKAAAQANRILISGRLASYMARAQSTYNLEPAATNVGVSDMLKDYKVQFDAAYDARPVPTYTASYATPVVLLPNRGHLTIQQTEELLQTVINEADRLLEVILI